MGHAQSKPCAMCHRLQFLGVVDQDGNAKVYCKIDVATSSILIVPDPIAAEHCLEFERFVGFKDMNGGVYCCEVERIDGACCLTKGWDKIVRSIGAVDGDYMVFDIKGVDETTISRVTGECIEGTCHGPIFAANQDEGEGPQYQFDMESDHTATDTSTDGLNGGDGINPALLFNWRGNFCVGRNVDLQDWMIHFVASGLNWQMPQVKIFVGRVDASSIANNRMRLPRGYTAENVLPLMTNKHESFVLQHVYENGKRVRFFIAKDAFIFSRRHGGLGIEIDVLTV